MCFFKHTESNGWRYLDFIIPNLHNPSSKSILRFLFLSLFLQALLLSIMCYRCLPSCVVAIVALLLLLLFLPVPLHCVVLVLPGLTAGIGAALTGWQSSLFLAQFDPPKHARTNFFLPCFPERFSRKILHRQPHTTGREEGALTRCSFFLHERRQNQI